jgi:hypothetical protein
MTLPHFGPSTVELFRYTVASADMFYAEIEERDVFVGSDEGGHIRIWGESASGASSTKVDLCRIFLEYTLYCSSWCNLSEARYHTERFGEKLGHRLADYLKQNPMLVTGENPAVGALECLFGSIGACYSTDHVEAGMRFLVTKCPLDDTARRLGLPNVELARQGINAMCRSMLLDMNPSMIVNTSQETKAQFLFTLREVTPA